MSTQPILYLTQPAIDRIEGHLSKNPGKHFRVSVEAGGCSGYQYDFGFDTKQDGDLVIPAGSIEIVVDAEAMKYLNGSTLDFVDDLKATGFTVTNPNATGTCGCGVSFTV